MTETEKKFWPEDTVFIVYLITVSLIITLFHRDVENWWVYVLTHSVSAGLVIVWVRFASAGRNTVIRTLRYWYIPIVLGFFYEQIDDIIVIIHARYLDPYVYNFELALLGFHPSVVMERISTPLVTEFMNVGYHSYYWIGPVLGLSLYLKKDYIPFRRTLFSILVAFFISYLGFIIFPVVGPRYELAHLYDSPLTGYAVTRLQQFIMASGDIMGGAMPSSHVAVALVVLLCAWTYRKRMALVFTPLVVTLAVSTVYNRYHYVSDVIAGIMVGLMAFYFGKWVYRDPGLETRNQGL